MSIYERFKQLINNKIEKEQLTQEFIEETTYRLGEFLKKGKITQEEYDELITLLNSNK